MSKTIYGIKQKYNPKDYVKYYSSRNGKGEPCNEQFGYINCVEYRCNVKGEIELRYTIGDFIGATSGVLITQEAIIEKAKQPNPKYGYKEYLEYQIKCNEAGIKNLQEQKARNLKALYEKTR